MATRAWAKIFDGEVEGRIVMKVLKFIVAGGSAFAVNVAFMYIFTEYFGWWYLVSATVSFILSIFVGFSMNKFWTFLDSSIKTIPVQVSYYLLINLFNLILNNVILFILVEYVSFWYIFAQVIASLAIAFESYFLYRKLFKKTL